MPTVWRTISRSVRGQAHLADGSPCQDSSQVEVFEGDAAMIACVADGAGSVPHSDLGSKLVCSAMIEGATRYLENCGDVSALTLDEILVWCELARDRIDAEAAVHDTIARDFASTLCVAILSSTGSCFFQIGDGAIVLKSGEVCGAVFWPDSGEYVNTTTFITSNEYRERLKFFTTERNYLEVALFTDGIERLALQFDTLTPHTPFFAPLFQALRTLENWHPLEDQLGAFLTSESVCKRSDDDKSLILAVRVDE
jgi:hypothetical protein